MNPDFLSHILTKRSSFFSLYSTKFFRNDLEAFTYGLKTQMASEEFSKDFSAEEQSEINDSIEKTIEWLDINDHESPETYNQKKIDLENLIQSFKAEQGKEEL